MRIEGIKAVVFDYGNTLIEFSARQAHACDDRLADSLTALFGPHDPHALRRIRRADRNAPYAGDPPEYLENDLPAITRATVNALYGRDPSDAELQTLLQTRFDAFVEVVTADPDTLPVLDRLAPRFRLALLSNYPDAPAIRESLRRTGLARFLDPVLVSADIGRVKPHPLPFRLMQEALALPPDAILYVGDNWLADVQGSRRAGWRSAWVTRWAPPEDMPRSAADLQPDATIPALRELPPILGL
jgi:putative hydrolase of the HAD superfamily